MMVTIRLIMVTAVAAVLAFAFMPSGLAQTRESGGGQSGAATFRPGDILSRAEVHILKAPGIYGLGPEPPGSHYAIAHGKLIRIDSRSMQVLSVLREQVRHTPD